MLLSFALSCDGFVFTYICGAISLFVNRTERRHPDHAMDSSDRFPANSDQR